MAKISCAFIDHQYHKKTQSSQFFKALLLEKMDVTEFYFSSFSKEELQGLIDTNFDLYIAYQYDFLTPFLLANGKKVLVVPMYDGTGECHIIHWLISKNALFLDFSENLYRTHHKLGLNAIYQHYYPPVSNQKPTVTYDTLRYFFWERQPSSGISVRWLAQKISSLEAKPTHIHLHLSPDPGEYSSIHPSAAQDLFPYAKVTTSTWFSSKSDFEKCLTSFNIYIAPRMVEGIGFSFLDAMGKGLFIMGLDYPTLNEYISNGETGCLLDSLGSPFPDLPINVLKQIATAGFLSFNEGRILWEQSWSDCMLKILDYIDSPATSENYKITALDAEKISYYFFNDYPSYLAMLSKIYSPAEKENIFVSKLAKLPLIYHLEGFFSESPVKKSYIEFAASRFKKLFNRSY